MYLKIERDFFEDFLNFLQNSSIWNLILVISNIIDSRVVEDKIGFSVFLLMDQLVKCFKYNFLSGPKVDKQVY